MLADAVRKLKKGIKVSEFVLKTAKVTPGRFAEEENVEISISDGKHTEHLMFAKVFHGRKPDYGQWVELFGVNADMRLGAKNVAYYGSVIEERIITLFATSMKSGEIFVEYDGDPETKWLLHHSVPPALTRPGFILYKLGFTWFKDWYYPEGFMEGSMKLQAEKTPKHAEEIRAQSLKFVEENAKSTNIFLKESVKRSGKI